MATICNFIRLVSLVFEPYMPSTSAKINFLLGCEKDERNSYFAKDLNENILNEGDFDVYFYTLTSRSSGLREPVPLFKKYT